MYNRIDIELQGVPQALHSSHVVSTMPLLLGKLEVGDEPAQLHGTVDTIEVRLQ